MIIDAHGHHVRRSHMAEVWWEGYGNLLIRDPQRRRGEPVTDLPSATDQIVGWLESLTGDALIEQMDAAGIDQMVLLPLDYGLLLGDGSQSIEQQNEDYARLAQKYPDRLIPFAGVDPRRGKTGLRLFERAVREWGCRGLKLHPASGFFLNDQACYAFYEKALELDVPVLVHTGFEAPPARSRFGDPLYLDDVCCDFPELRVVAAHMALYHFWRPQLIQLARFHRELRVDVSALQPAYREDPIGFYHALREDMDTLGHEKILFGSDHPYFTGRRLGLSQWVDVFRKPPEDLADHGIEFRQEELDALLGGNAATWLAGSNAGSELSD
jgi:uncharacterized protein